MSKETDRLEWLVGFMRKHKVAELRVENDTSKVHLVLADEQSSASTEEIKAPQTITAKATNTQAKKSVAAPMAGVFYRSPSPDSEPFVTVGQKVARGDALCIIESMKMMNLVETEYTGIITAIHAANGQAVSESQALLTIAVEPAKSA